MTSNEPDAIDAFWTWWKANARQLADAIATRNLEPWATPISERVHAIHPRLVWELGPGKQAQHHLCVAAAGDPVLRLTTEKWLAAAPAPDETWEYYPAKQRLEGVEGITIQVSDTLVPLDEFRILARVLPTRRLVDTTIYHPAFGTLAEDARVSLTFIFLDNLLGEDGVDSWVGAVELADACPDGALEPLAFRDVVDRVASQTDPSAFTALRGETPSGPLIVSAALGIKRADHLLLDHHFEVAFPAVAPNGHEASIRELQELGDELLAELGHDAVFIGAETTTQGRTLHLHASLVGPVPVRLEAWLGAKGRDDVEVTAEPDPRWQVLDRWGRM